jgi:hypothetical protein
MGGGVDGLALPDDPVPAVDRNVRLVAEGRDGDVDLRLAVDAGFRQGLSKNPCMAG